MKSRLSADIDAQVAAMQEKARLRCPRCNTIIYGPGASWNEDPPVSYYGSSDTGPHEVICEHCALEFKAEEHVERTYTVPDDWDRDQPDDREGS